MGLLVSYDLQHTIVMGNFKYYVRVKIEMRGIFDSKVYFQLARSINYND